MISNNVVCATSKGSYAQSDQSLCSSLEYSMRVKLLTEHHLECHRLKMRLHSLKTPNLSNVKHFIFVASKSDDFKTLTFWRSLILGFLNLVIFYSERGLLFKEITATNIGRSAST